MTHHALVFGASGILGWAAVNEILSSYPQKGTYSRVTAITNRPLSFEDSLWPTPGPETPALNLICGIDLLNTNADDLKQTLKEKAPDIETVDHVFYFAYKFDPDFSTEAAMNLSMVQHSFDALESLALNLRYVVFPTGTKGYGIHLPSRPYKAPFVETMNTLPEPARSELFYYVIRDELTQRQKGKAWKWAEVRCDMIVGFVPHSSPYNLVGTYGNFLSLYRFMHEKGHPDALSPRVPYPSPGPSFRVLNNEGNQRVFAHFSIHLCLNPQRSGNGELYNIGGETVPVSYGDRWRDIVANFGLEGVDPVDKEDARYLGGAVGFVRSHGDMVEKLRREKGVDLQVITFEDGFDMWMEVFDFDHHLALEKTRSVGFKKEEASKDIWKWVLGIYARAGKQYLGDGGKETKWTSRI
ncbi:uncharacterized protein K452DRAFT_278583 [Aplosporella prunicola CBS 121167]|uniref:PRISE-like Rossmann-fold domain-containing protein n=1 Tax=Aplosporella prunicola CBS 121167 TaxID=1176127 RepID=A0A6A6B2W7_9PEZI|nr:uncharacterized protein K452DRAFT_278583 [Aplosporella prunicola CBS 121167]KAF2137357.1 hypothetical protein K452DRAFT_278583 [Aplosporella prunicola CBS 121167]